MQVVSIRDPRNSCPKCEKIKHAIWTSLHDNTVATQTSCIALIWIDQKADVSPSLCCALLFRKPKTSPAYTSCVRPKQGLRSTFLRRRVVSDSMSSRGLQPSSTSTLSSCCGMASSTAYRASTWDGPACLWFFLLALDTLNTSSATALQSNSRLEPFCSAVAR